MKEDAPSNSVGASSSVRGTGHVDTFDPPLSRRRKILRRFRDVVKR